MKIILIDDHPLVRKGIISVLSLEKDLEVIGEASNIKEGLNMLNENNPDLVLLDLKLGNENGLDILECFSKSDKNFKFLILTSSANESDFRRAKELGAQGYILKESLPEEMIYAIQLVGRGRKYYDPGIMDEVMNEYDNDNMFDELTEREQEVLVALGEGLHNKEIADRLYISVYTVKKHVSQILSKLELTDRTQAALYVQSKLQKIS